MALEKLKFFFTVFFLLAFTVPTFASDAMDINIQGLKRTKPHIVEDIVRKHYADPSKIANELQKTQLFSDVNVSVSDSTLNITVQEKFSIIPVPFAFAHSDNWGGGLVLMDNNAFGLMDKATIGTFVTKESWRTLAQYTHVQSGDAFCGWNASINGGKSETKLRDEDGDLIMKYDSDNFTATAGLTKKFTPWLKAHLESGINVCNVDDDIPHSEFIIPATFGISASISAWDGTFLNTTSLSVSAAENFNIWHEHYYTLYAKAVWEQHLVQRLRIISNVAAFYSPDVPIVFAKNQNAAGISLLNNAYRVSAIAGGSAGFEWGIKKFVLGMPSIYAQYQICWADNILGGDTWAHGPVLGFRFYLSKITFSAVDIFASYNVKTDLYRVSAGAGFSF